MDLFAEIDRAVAAGELGQRVAVDSWAPSHKDRQAAARAGRSSVLWHYVSRTPIAVPDDLSLRKIFYVARWRYQLRLCRITPHDHAERIAALSRGEIKP